MDSLTSHNGELDYPFWEGTMTILADVRSRTRGWHRPSALAAATFGVVAVLCVAALLVDQRTLEGAPIWAKPLKFAVSGALYFATWSWLVSLLPRFPRPASWLTNLPGGWRVSLRPRVRRRASWLTNFLVLIFALEYVLLVSQAARGRASHFNNA